MSSPRPNAQPMPSLQGKTVMITGANSGIGRASAMGIAKLGARVVMVCRNAEKGARAVEWVSRVSGNREVELIVCDLSLMSNVRKLAADFLASHKALNVLVNNAGSVFQGYRETAEGLERTMAVNYFSPFLLTGLLLPALRAGSPSRVVNVASVSHFGGKLDLADLNGKKGSGGFGMQAYGRSKLALVLFTYELSRRWAKEGISANCLHPGAVRTAIWSHSGAASPIVRFVSLFMRSPQRGAETVVYLSASPDAEGVTGKYYFDMKPRQSSTASYDESLATRLWAASELATGLKVP